MTARFPALLILSTCLLAAAPAAAQSILGQTMNGSDTVNIQLKGATSFAIKQPNATVAILDVDALGNGTYATSFDIDGNAPSEQLAYDLTIDTSGRKPVLLLDDLSQFESALAVMIRAHNPTGFRAVTVTIDPASVKTKLKVGSNLTLNAKFAIDLHFTATTSLAGYEMLRGKVQFRPRVTATLPGSCTACGATYTGTSSILTTLDRCGVIDQGGGDSTLVIDPDIDDDGSADFVFTDTHGTTLIGVIGQAGKRLTCTIGQTGQDALFDVIEAEIVTQCPDLLDDLMASVLDARLRFLTCTGKADKTATKISIEFFMSYRTLTIPAVPGQAGRQGPGGTSNIDGKFRAP